MRTTAGRDKAARYLSALLSRPQSGDCRLPPVRTLAKAAGVSLVTMVKAVRELRLQGRIETIHGKSMRAIRPAGGSAAASQEPAPSIRLWQSIRRDLERSILTGAYDRSVALPSLKEMGNRFGASYRTLKKALDYLRARGTIERYGRGYRVARHANPAGRYEVLIFICREDETLSLSYLDPHLIRHIESICRQAGAGAAAWTRRGRRKNRRQKLGVRIHRGVPGPALFPAANLAGAGAPDICRGIAGDTAALCRPAGPADRGA